MSERGNALLNAVLLGLAVIVSLIGGFVIAGALAALYLLLVQGVTPGQRIFLDAVAPSVSGALLHLANGVCLAVAPFALRRGWRRWPNRAAGSAGFCLPVAREGYYRCVVRAPPET
jgi:hypothetical protein